MLLRAGVEKDTWLSVSLLKSIDVGSKGLDVAVLVEDVFDLVRMRVSMSRARVISMYNVNLPFVWLLPLH